MHDLQVMWEEERKEQQVEERQSFVDLGCGNGLLVYLLSREGVSISFSLGLPFLSFLSLNFFISLSPLASPPSLSPGSPLYSYV